MKTLDDIRAALEGCEYEIKEGTDPVAIERVSDQPAPDALSWMKTPKAGAVSGVIVCPVSFNTGNATLIRTSNPRLVFARVASRLFPVCYPEVRPADAIYADKASIGNGGFGYVRNDDGRLESFPHYAGVVLGNNVSIGFFTCIDRGALTDTVIEDGVKLDNLVHIAHGAHIGAHTSIAALTCIEGSVKIGKRCTIGSGVTFQIGSGCGDDVTVGSGSVVTKWIPDGEVWLGNPARRWK